MGDPFKVVTVMMVLSLLRVKQTVMMVDVELMIMMLPTHGDHNIKGGYNNRGASDGDGDYQ